MDEQPGILEPQTHPHPEADQGPGTATGPGKKFPRRRRYVGLVRPGTVVKRSGDATSRR
jgi:hypothetical protein